MRRITRCAAPSMLRRMAVGSPGREHPLTDVEQLQRSAGNRAVLRLLRSGSSGATPGVSPQLESYLAQQGRGGQPLPTATRAYFEPRFDRDFGDVRVHSDSQAAGAAAEINARAFTLGSDVYLGAGGPQPGTPQGDRLLAHELTHVAQQQPAAVIKRQPLSTTAGTPTAATYRESVLDAIRFFETGASFYGRRSVPLDRAAFDRVMNGWYGMVVGQESIIDTQLGRDAGLKRDLHTAYIAAIRAVMTKAASTLHKTEDDLYRENSGRIPMWAWQTPHHLEPGISTPIAQGRAANRAGNVVFASHGFDITIKPDLTGQRLRTAAHTSALFSWSGVRFSHDGSRRDLVTRFDPLTTPAVEIQTKLSRGTSQTSQSAYGRGTTREDIAGGAVTPRSTTLGFHEGAHGVDIVKFLESNPPPAFRGAVGMTKVEFEAEITRWQGACNDYATAVAAFAARTGDCVGTTIDQFRQANARRGTRIVLECGP